MMSRPEWHVRCWKRLAWAVGLGIPVHASALWFALTKGEWLLAAALLAVPVAAYIAGGMVGSLFWDWFWDEQEKRLEVG